MSGPSPSSCSSPRAALGVRRRQRELGLVRTEVYRLRGDSARAEAYADSARIALETQLRTAPDDWQRHALLGLALA